MIYTKKYLTEFSAVSEEEAMEIFINSNDYYEDNNYLIQASNWSDIFTIYELISL